MTPFAVSEEFDDLGRLQRTCSSDVSVNKCEGACTSQVQPSVITPTGFLKARPGSKSSSLTLTLLLPTGHRNSYINNVHVICFTYLKVCIVTVFITFFSGWKPHQEFKIHKHFRDKRRFHHPHSDMTQFPVYLPYIVLDLESTLSLTHAATWDRPNAKLYQKTDSGHGVFLWNFYVFEATDASVSLRFFIE